MAKRIYSYLSDEDYVYYEILRDGVKDGKYGFSSVSEAFAHLIKSFVVGPAVEIIRFDEVIKEVERAHDVKIVLAKDSREYGESGKRLGFKGYFITDDDRDPELTWDLAENLRQFVRIAYTQGERFVLFLYTIETEWDMENNGELMEDSSGTMHVRIVENLEGAMVEMRSFVIDEDLEGVLRSDIDIKILKFLDKVAVQTGKEPPEVYLLDI